MKGVVHSSLSIETKQAMYL